MVNTLSEMRLCTQPVELGSFLSDLTSSGMERGPLNDPNQPSFIHLTSKKVLDSNSRAPIRQTDTCNFSYMYLIRPIFDLKCSSYFLLAFVHTLFKHKSFFFDQFKYMCNLIISSKLILLVFR